MAESPVLKSQILCRKYEYPEVTLKTSGNLVRVLWSNRINRQVNTAEEILVIQVMKQGRDIPAFEKQVTFLNATEFYFDESGPATVRFVRKKRFQLHLTTGFRYTPKVSLVSENEGRHHLTWNDIDWTDIRRRLEIARDIEWEKDVEICLHVLRWPQEGSDLPEEEWIPVGMSDNAQVLGALRQLSLDVMERTDRLSEDNISIQPADASQARLASLFTLDFPSPEITGELFSAEIDIPVDHPFMELKREVWEEDSVQLRAWWHLPPVAVEEICRRILEPAGLSQDDMELYISLHGYGARGISKAPVQGPFPVGTASDWLFTGVDDNAAYLAVLDVRKRSDGNASLGHVIHSNISPIPAREDHVVLLPIDHERAFAYWHLDSRRLEKRMAALSRGGTVGVRTIIRVFNLWGGELHHHMDKDAEIHPGFTDNYYLRLEPDKVYQVQLAAVNDEGKLEELTPFSNPVQTARLYHGNNPVDYRDVPQVTIHPSHRRLNSVMNTPDNSKGLMVIHLHAHLPYIRQRVSYGSSGIWEPRGYPPEWFHEAVLDTYGPFILVFEKLREEGVDFRLSMDISPTLSNMMRCPLLQEEFLQYIEAHISLARAEVDRTRREAPQYNHTAWMHLNRFVDIRDCFLRYNCDLTAAFREFQDQGYLEISTCGATHGFLPLFTAYPESIRAQIQTAVRDYQATFGRDPIGIWLPECAYVPGIEQFVQEAGLRYFFAETHAVLNADSPAAFGTNAPVYLKGSDVAVFARDQETGKQVWSGEEGYPGDPDYLDFHIKGGPLRYNRITSRESGWEKAPYNREWAVEKVAIHAQHFMESRNFRFNHIKNWYWKKPLAVAMYDAELFGHHWYEGVDFLYYLMKKLYYNQNETELITPGAYLARYPRNQEVFITPSSWGEKGSFDKWMYGSVAWMYRHSHAAIRELVAMATHLRDRRSDNALYMRIVAQASREVLQAMNSDVPFVISNGHFVDRMKELFLKDLENFWILAGLYWHGGDNERTRCRLGRMEMENPIFPDIDPIVFALQ